MLLARVVAGDDRALALLYDEHAPAVLAVARRVTRNDQLATEVVQDVFVLLWQSPERIDLAKGTVRTYLRVVAHRRAVDAVRRSERRASAEAAASAAGAPVDAASRAGAGPEELVTDAAAARWCDAVLAGAVATLPEEQREVLRLTYLEGRTMTDAAELLGIPLGTVKSRCRLGLARIRTLVAPDLEAGR